MDSELNPFSQFPRHQIETADTLRSKAKTYLMMTGMEGLAADRIVECIIGAAVLEAVERIKLDAETAKAAVAAEACRG